MVSNERIYKKKKKKKKPIQLYRRKTQLLNKLLAEVESGSELCNFLAWARYALFTTVMSQRIPTADGGPPDPSKSETPLCLAYHMSSKTQWADSCLPHFSSTRGHGVNMRYLMQLWTLPTAMFHSLAKQTHLWNLTTKTQLPSFCPNSPKLNHCRWGPEYVFFNL